MKQNDWIEVLILSYIILASTIAFCINNINILALFFITQIVIVFFITKSVNSLRPPVFLLLSFILFYAVFEKRGEFLSLGFITIYKDGLKEGTVMSVRIYILIILTSILSYRRENVIELLKKLRLPEVFVLTLQIVLSLREERINFKEGIRDLIRGRTESIVYEIIRKRKEVEGKIKGDERIVKDVSLISSLSFFYLLTRYIKIAPGFPFSPGYKNVLIVPLYICASSLSSRKGGGIIFGCTAGVISLPFGNKYGIFGALKEVIGGVVSDLISFDGGMAFKAFKGGLVGLARFSSVLILALIAKVPNTYYAFLGIFALSHVTFGILGGIVSHYIIRSLTS